MKILTTHVLVHRDTNQQKTESGIILNAQDPSDDIVVAKVVDWNKDKVKLKGIKAGDDVYIVRMQAKKVEKMKDHYLVEAEHLVGKA